MLACRAFANPTSEARQNSSLIFNGSVLGVQFFNISSNIFIVLS